MQSGTRTVTTVIVLLAWSCLVDAQPQEGDFGVLAPLGDLLRYGASAAESRAFTGATIQSVYCNAVLLNERDPLPGNRTLRPILRDSNISAIPTILSALEFAGVESPRPCPADYPYPCGTHEVPVVAGGVEDFPTLEANKILASQDVAQIGSYILEPNMPGPDVFSRVLYDATTEMQALVEVIQHFSWTRIAIISEDDRWDFVYNMQALLHNTNITTVSTTVTGSDGSEAAIERALLATQRAEGRIIIVHSSTVYARALLQKADQLGMLNSQYQFQEFQDEEVQKLAVGTMGITIFADTTTAGLQSILDKGDCAKRDAALFPNLAGWEWVTASSLSYYLTYTDIVALIHGAYKVLYTLQDACNDARDAPYTQELLNNVTAVSTCNEAVSREYRTPLLVELIRRQKFSGTYGNIDFDSTGSVKRKFALVNRRSAQFNNILNEGVAVIDSQSGTFRDYDYRGSKGSLSDVRYRSDADLSRDVSELLRAGSPPWDGSWTDEVVFVNVSDGAFIAVLVASAAGVLWAMFSLSHSVWYRQKPIIRMSSPTINYICLLGCMLAYTTPIMFGFDTSRISEDSFVTLCHLRIWVCSLSFTLLFGAIFSKTYRVHRIFNSPSHEVVTITDGALVSILTVLIVVDVVALSVWSSTGDFRYTLYSDYPEQHMDTFTRVTRQWDTCESDHMATWMWVVLSWKAVLLAVGAWLAVQVRHVHIPALNDSRWVGFCIYNVALLSSVVIPVTVLLSHVEERFVFLASGIFVMVTSVVLLLFFPKMWAIWTKTEENWVRSSAAVTRSGHLNSSSGNRTHKVSQNNTTATDESVGRFASVDVALAVMPSPPSTDGDTPPDKAATRGKKGEAGEVSVSASTSSNDTLEPSSTIASISQRAPSRSRSHSMSSNHGELYVTNVWYR